MREKILFLILGLLFLTGPNVFADDVSIDSNGNITAGTSNTNAQLEVTAGSAEGAILGITSGTGAAGVYGIRTDNGNYGILGNDHYGVYGNSAGGYAGYFQGNARVTGNLTVDGAFTWDETDPQVGTLINDMWCTSNGSQVNCATAAPLTTEVSITGGSMSGVDLTGQSLTGVTGGEIAGDMAISGNLEVSGNYTNAFIVEKADGTDVMKVSTNGTYGDLRVNDRSIMDQTRASFDPLLARSLRIPYHSARVTSVDAGTNGDTTAVVYDGRYIWACNATGGNIIKIDPETAAVVATINVSPYPFGAAFDGTHIWVTTPGMDSLGTAVKKVNISTNVVDDTVTVNANPRFVVFDGMFIWVSNGYPSNTIQKIDPAIDRVVETVNVGAYPMGMAFDGTHVWVVNRDDNTVMKINVTTNIVDATITVGIYPVAVAFDGTHIWVVNRGATIGPDSVSVINVNSNTVEATLAVGDRPRWIAFDGTHMWVSNRDDHTISRIDVVTRVPTTFLAVAKTVNDAFPFGAAFDGAHMWIANNGDDTVNRYIVR